LYFTAFTSFVGVFHTPSTCLCDSPRLTDTGRVIFTPLLPGRFRLQIRPGVPQDNRIGSIFQAASAGEAAITIRRGSLVGNLDERKE